MVKLLFDEILFDRLVIGWDLSRLVLLVFFELDQFEVYTKLLRQQFGVTLGVGRLAQ